MRIWKAKIIVHNEIKALLECECCKSAEILLVPLEKEFVCKWCEEVNVIDEEDILAFKKKKELLDES
jgi:hypothetical protein